MILLVLSFFLLIPTLALIIRKLIPVSKVTNVNSLLGKIAYIIFVTYDVSYESHVTISKQDFQFKKENEMLSNFKLDDVDNRTYVSDKLDDTYTQVRMVKEQEYTDRSVGEFL